MNEYEGNINRGKSVKRDGVWYPVSIQREGGFRYAVHAKSIRDAKLKVVIALNVEPRRVCIGNYDLPEVDHLPILGAAVSNGKCMTPRAARVHGVERDYQ